jgi:hypothetical protein
MLAQVRVRPGRETPLVETIELLPEVKAYPQLSRTYGEVSCIAGIQTAPDGPRWIRLYPVPFRALGDAQQFAKYQPLRVRAEAHSGDRRPETRRPDRDSIELVGEALPTSRGWESRRRFVEPLMAESMCGIQRRQVEDGTSLAVFRPADVLDLVIEKRDVDRDKQALANAWAAQPSLFAGLDADEQSLQTEALELIPWTFKYKYRCSDTSCNGHEQTIVDWEIAELYRHVRDRENWRDLMRSKWIEELCAADRDSAFFVGNQHQHPVAFLVLGVWWPPRKPDQLRLAI